MKNTTSHHRNSWKWVLPTVFILGAVMRFIWPSDMEFKYDELFMFDRTQNIGVTEKWPWLGMTSGGGFRNPGLSIWIFAVFAKMFFIKTEIGLVRVVMFLNTAALGLLMLAGYRFLPWLYGDKKLAERDRPVWLWSSVLIAVNPLTLLFERKIWAQSILPIFSTLFLFSWLKRSSRWGAFFWGFIGACLGQIHMSGFFFAAGFLGWTLYKERSQTTLTTNWKWWLAGSGVGAILISPWVYYMILELLHKSESSAQLPPRSFNLNFWKFWIEDAIGLENPFYFEKRNYPGAYTGSGISYSLGPFIEAFYGDYILAKISRVVLFVTAIGIYGATVWHLIRFPKNLKNILKPHSPASEATLATGLGMGALITAFPITVFRHYLIIAHPLQWFFLVRLALDHLKKSKAALMVIFLGNLSLSLLLLYFLHINGGAPGGDYGTAFKLQPRFQKSLNSR